MAIKMIKIKLAIVISDYYEDISSGLLRGAEEYCNKNNLIYDVFKVPGALEIGSAIKIISNKDTKGQYKGYIALGCVIRGETSHFEIVINESSRALTSLSLDSDIIIGNGILTVENENQALARSDKSENNKGYHAAYACNSLIKLREDF
tara:strand:- start:237 stop:683 length:447 start_codon:yes stop_codon:yes gene_type:complete